MADGSVRMLCNYFGHMVGTCDHIGIPHPIGCKLISNNLLTIETI